MTHIVCVDAYEGAFEPITEAGAHRPAGLGLPWTELAELLDARVTLLDWTMWYDYEERGDSPASWMRFPATRLVIMRPTPRTQAAHSPRVMRRAIVPRDPDSDVPLDSRPLSKRAHGTLPRYIQRYRVRRDHTARQVLARAAAGLRRMSRS